MLQRSRASGAAFFPPRVCEPGTGAQDLEWFEASGAATVYATTVIRKKPPERDFNIALVDLAEGPRMMTRIEGVAPEAVRIGMAVRAEIIREGETPAVIFRPLA